MKDKYDIIAIALVLGVPIFLLGLLFCSAVVPAGQVGVVDSFGQLSPNLTDSGLKWKNPWTSIIAIPIQTQLYSAKASAASSDLQDVATDVAVNYRLEPDYVISLYKIEKANNRPYQDIIIANALQESVKAITARFSAAELITERPTVKQQVENSLSQRLSTYGIIVDSVSITNFEFSQSFNEAINSKVAAEQQALQAKNKLEQVKIEKEQAITQAEAIAESTKLKADADAYSLKVINEELAKSTNLVQYRAIEKWNGTLPMYTGGPVPFINVNTANYSPAGGS